MKPFRRRGDVVVGGLEQAEVQVLGLLVDQLEQLLSLDAVDAGGDPVVERLLPSGHATDADIARDYRDLTEASLREGKADDLAVVRASVPDGGGEVWLDADQARAWLRTTNDLRLALGTRLGITADTQPPEDPADEDPADEEDQQHAVYSWLTAVQGSLVDALVAGGRRR